jgi:hypothetical protein
MNEEWNNEDVAYTATNENLDGIVGALRICPKDSVLTIGGSGDQAIAFLEKASKVFSVDSSPAQTDFFRKRVACLQRGDVDNFFDTGPYGSRDGFLHGSHSLEKAQYFRERRKEYFLWRDRLSKIRPKLPALEISDPGDVLSVASTTDGFTKIYLSNIWGWGIGNLSMAFVMDCLANMGERLPENGLVYVTNHSTISAHWTTFGQKRNPAGGRTDNIHLPYDIDSAGFLPRSLVLDVSSTMCARDGNHEMWFPAVYRKVVD